MKSLPFKAEGYKLLHEGALALSGIELNGMRVDVPYLKRAISDTTEKIRKLEEELKTTDVWVAWRKRYGPKAKLNSHEQLGVVLFEDMEFESHKSTDSGRYSTDDEALAEIDHPFAKGYLDAQRLRKAKKTYLLGIEDERVGEFLHPSFHLNVARTYRSTASEPNMQNIPVRNKEIYELVRRAFVARPGRRLVELDYRGIEVCIAACYHKDPTMISYIEDRSKDMHRDTAAEIYLLDPSDVTKQTRYVAKNRFVFPEFYGAYYKQQAPELWKSIDQLKLDCSCPKCAVRAVVSTAAESLNKHCKLCGGTGRISLKQHLRRKGIKERGPCIAGEEPVPGTFEAHVRDIERAFWEERFPVYTRWKKEWFDRYQERGWMQTKTGFVLQGKMKRTQVINSPVQGSAFQCLLWSICQLQLRELRRADLAEDALLVNQIHDSLIGDVVARRVKEFIRLANDVMTKRIVDHWPWICVPLEIEAEITPVDGAWTEKKEYKDWIQTPRVLAGDALEAEEPVDKGDEDERGRHKKRRS